jgi:ammonium transporter Rh
MSTQLSSVVDVLKYFQAINVMAMLLLGFGFLMAFVRGYGRSALTATFLLVSISIPLYICKDSFGLFGAGHSDVDMLILSEFAAASLLICAGAVLGRLKMYQYLLLAVLFVPCYAFNEWVLASGGLGFIAKGSFVDTGGSILIHAFGALFGLGVAVSMTTKKEFRTPIEADSTSERFSLLGSMVLWLFWPSFCSALVAPEDVPKTILNVVIALCGATVATYVACLVTRGRLVAADIANASLAGGVAIGATCDSVALPVALLIGVLAGALSTFGFAVIQGRLQAAIRKVDTCGVLYLHGLPGLLGGVAAIVIGGSFSRVAELKGIVITVVLALVLGLIVGRILLLLGTRRAPYVDSEEFGEEPQFAFAESAELEVEPRPDVVQP